MKNLPPTQKSVRREGAEGLEGGEAMMMFVRVQGRNRLDVYTIF